MFCSSYFIILVHCFIVVCLLFWSCCLFSFFIDVCFQLLEFSFLLCMLLINEVISLIMSTVSLLFYSVSLLFALPFIIICVGNCFIVVCLLCVCCQLFHCCLFAVSMLFAADFSIFMFIVLRF